VHFAERREMDMTNIYKGYQYCVWEITGVIIITLFIALFAGGFKGISLFIPLLYLFIEKAIRHRSWETLGFKFKNTITDIKQNGYLISLVGFIIPILTVAIANLFLPEFFDHLKERVPVFKLFHRGIY
jgi:ABC-type uncharacterized transport system permease subunit